MLRKEPVQFVSNPDDEQQPRRGRQQQQQQPDYSSRAAPDTHDLASPATARKRDGRRAHRQRVITTMTIGNSSVVRDAAAAMAIGTTTSAIQQRRDRMARDLFLPWFLCVDGTSAVVSIKHAMALWFHAAMQEKCNAIFWMDLTLLQQVMIRARLRKRHRRRQPCPPKSLLRRHLRQQWYGLYPCPPSERTKRLWLNQLTSSPPCSVAWLHDHLELHESVVSLASTADSTPTADDNHPHPSPVPISSSTTSPCTVTSDMLMTASSAETLCTSDLATAPPPPDTMKTNSATTGSNTISESDTRDHAHNSTTCATSELERLLEQDASMRKRLKRPWMPPINSDTLQELAMPNVFRSIQLRHDLVFDQCLSFRPNLDGSSGRDKINKAERYWRRVDRAFQDLGTDAMQIDDLHHPQRLAFLRVILEELASILVSLRAPYASSPAANEPWPWPANVSLRHVKAVMDVDLILQQIHHAIYDIDPLVKVVSAILHPLCPAHEAPRLQLLHRYVQEKKYAKALRQCFSILEAIKLDCANRVLKNYRQHLIETSPPLEFQCFLKQLENGEIKLDSTHKWLRRTWRRVGKHAPFLDVYHRGIVHLLTDDPLTTKAYEIPSVPFPIVLQFDERRLLQQFRQEFQSMMLVSLLLIPYRYYAGAYSSTGDIVKLKRLCVQVCWDMHATGFPVMASLQDRKDVMHLYHRLVYKACHRGLAARARRDASAQPLMEQKEAIAPFTPRQLAEDAAQLWACWLITHLDPASAIYKLMYERMCHLLGHLSQHGPNLDENATNAMERMVGIQENILALGEKIKLLTDLNLATFGPIFKWLAKDISENHLHPDA